MRRHIVAVVASAGLVATAITAGPAAADTGAPATASCAPYALPGLPGGDGSGEVMWINDAGVYVGGAGAADGSSRAVWWTHTGTDLSAGWTLHPVPGLPATDNTEVLDVNASGVMVGDDLDTGQSWVYDGGTGALSWLPELSGGTWEEGRRINASGEVSGVSQARDGNGYAAVWFPPYTSATRLADAGASQSYGTRYGARYKAGSWAPGINDLGVTAGQTELGGQAIDVSTAAEQGFWRGGLAPLLQAVEWHANGQVDRLPAGLNQGYAFAINNTGTVVGAADFATSAQAWLAPAYWSGGQVHDMAMSDGIVFGIARGISQGGWAAGGVILSDNTSQPFVWTGAGTLQLLAPVTGFTEGNSHAVNDHYGQVGGDSASDTAQVATVWQCPVGFTTG